MFCKCEPEPEKQRSRPSNSRMLTNGSLPYMRNESGRRCTKQLVHCKSSEPNIHKTLNVKMGTNERSKGKTENRHFPFSASECNVQAVPCERAELISYSAAFN